MSLFSQIADAVTDVVDAVSDATKSWQKQHRKTKEAKYANKELKYEKQIAESMLKNQAKMYTGMATGTSPYDGPAATMAGFGQAAEPIAEAVGSALESYFGFKGVAAAANAATSGANAALDAASAPSNTLSTPLGNVNLSTAAIVAGAAVLAVVMSRD